MSGHLLYNNCIPEFSSSQSAEIRLNHEVNKVDPEQVGTRFGGIKTTKDSKALLLQAHSNFTGIV